MGIIGLLLTDKIGVKAICIIGHISTFNEYDYGGDKIMPRLTTTSLATVGSAGDTF